MNTVEHDTVSGIGFLALVVVLPVVLVALGLAVRRRPERWAVRTFWLVGIVASLVVGVGGGELAHLFPPAPGPLLESGLDLRGLAFDVGGALGGVAGLAVTILLGGTLAARHGARRSGTAGAG